MSEDVVYLLEAVEVEAKHGGAAIGPDLGKFATDEFLEQEPVGQARQQIVSRQEAHALLAVAARAVIDEPDRECAHEDHTGHPGNPIGEHGSGQHVGRQ